MCVCIDFGVSVWQRGGPRDREDEDEVAGGEGVPRQVQRAGPGRKRHQDEGEDFHEPDRLVVD